MIKLFRKELYIWGSHLTQIIFSLPAFEERRYMRRRIAKVESELWSYISRGDGLHCPFHSHCKSRQNGVWCLGDNIERLSELQIAEQIIPQNYDFIKSSTICNIFKMVESLSKIYLDLGGIQCPPVPTDLVSLIDGQDIEIRTLSLKGCSGAVCYFDNKWIIYLNAKDPLASRRFSLPTMTMEVMISSSIA